MVNGKKNTTATGRRVIIREIHEKGLFEHKALLRKCFHEWDENASLYPSRRSVMQVFRDHESVAPVFNLFYFHVGSPC